LKENIGKYKLQKNCFYHKDIPAGFICDNCGYEWQATMPVLCPSDPEFDFWDD